jgi:hypothetical protein
MPEETTQDPFAGSKEIKPGKFAWGKPGDFIIGYFTSSQEVDTENGRKKLYEIKAIQGQYHEVENSTDPSGNKVVKVAETATKLEPGDFYNIFGRDDLDKFFQKAKIGQQVGLQFKDIQPSKKKGYSAFKIIKTAIWDVMMPSDEDVVAEADI